MRKRTKLLSALLSLVMVLGLLPAAALAAEPEINWLPGGVEPLGYIEETDQILAISNGGGFLLDTKGNVVRALGNLGYDIVYEFQEGMALAQAGSWPDSSYGFIDHTGALVVPLEYENAHGFSNGLAPVEKDGLWGYIDKTGKTVLPMGYTDASSFSEGLAAVMVGDSANGKWGYIDKTGNVVIPFEYSYAGDFSEGLALVQKDGKSSFIDKTGKVVISLQDEMCESFSNGRAVVYSELGTASYIDKTGQVIFSVPDCGAVRSFSEGLVQIISSDYETTRFMDTDGDTVLTLPKGMSASWFGFTGGVMEVSGTAGTGLIDKTGAYVLAPSKDYLSVQSMGPCIVVLREDETYGIFQNPHASQPEQPTQPVTPATAEAMPTNDKLTVNGVLQNPTVYKINDSNYFKIRDLAAVLNGTSKQFAVGYDAASSSVTATSGQGYTKLDTDLVGAASGNQTAAVSSDTIIVNGQVAEVEVYKIDGSNYFKLRDLGDALGFEVGWSAEQGIFINTEG